MKTKNIFCTVLLLLLAIIIARGWHHGLQPPPRTQESAAQKPADAVVADDNPASTQLPVAKRIASAFALPSGWQAMSVDDMIASPVGRARIDQFQQQWDGENGKSLDFYGKVIDQHGDPVPNVKVKAGVGLYVSVDRSGGKEYYTESDLHGLFNFVGLHGAGVGFTLQKEGYSYDQTLLSSSRPNNYVPDPNNPTVFTMWKLMGAEPMVHKQLDSRVPYDGRSEAFDLLSGKKSATGELQVTLTRTPVQVKRGVDHFGWNVQLQVLGGGIVEATDLYKNLAPEAGYQQILVFAQAKDAPKWTENLTKTFYVHTAKGLYGRVIIDLTMDSERPDTGISIESWLNPAGSRNLEFDPAKEIKPK